MTDLAACLPDFVIAAMREALPLFDRRIPGFAMADAVMTGVETRTSSPLRITRGRDFAEHQYQGIVPGGRRGRLCRRHSLGGGRRDQGRRGGRAFAVRLTGSIHKRYVRERIMPSIKCLRTAGRQCIKCREALFRRRRIGLVTEAIENMAIVIALEPVAMRHDGIDRGTQRCPDLRRAEILGGKPI